MDLVHDFTKQFRDIALPARCDNTTVSHNTYKGLRGLNAGDIHDLGKFRPAIKFGPIQLRWRRYLSYQVG